MGAKPNTSEADLLGLLQLGDPAATERFVREHTGRCLAVARRVLSNEADAMDAVQDAFASFFRALPTFNAQSRLSTWLHRIVVNAALMRRRARARRPEVAIEDLTPKYAGDGHRVDPQPAWQASAEELAASAEVREIVRDRIAQLPDEYRNVIWMRDIEGLDTHQTAEALGATPGAIKTRLHRARQALRTLLESEFASWQPS